MPNNEAKVYILEGIKEGSKYFFPQMTESAITLTGAVEDLGFTLSAGKKFATIITEDSTMVCNSMIIGAGFYTGGTSLMGYKATTNPAAKTCYGLSALYKVYH